MNRPLTPRTFRGTVLVPDGATRSIRVQRDALIVTDASGRIATFGPAPAECQEPETQPGTVWSPGFVDAHLHFPQTRVIGRSSGDLLRWLERTVFPEEARFVETAYAASVANEFCRSLVAHGTTCSAIYGSSHPEATAALFSALDRVGLRATVGLTLMDQGAPAAICLAADVALSACEALIARWHGHDEGRLRFAVTPRYALSCSEELLRGAGELARRLDLPVQTHLSEMVAEVEAVGRAFPDRRDYLDVYDHFGLLNHRSIFGHCVWLNDDAWARMAAAEASCAHCPDSNAFLHSGTMPLHRARSHGVRVGLGSDIGAGRTFSMRRVASAAYDAAGLHGAPISAGEALYLATAGGADALGLGGQVGRIARGFDADLIAMEIPDGLDDDALLDHVVFRADAGLVKRVYVRGRLVV